VLQERKSVFGRLQMLAQLGKTPARPELKIVLRKSKPERVVEKPRTENFCLIESEK
jgi:hypothetical protein